MKKWSDSKCGRAIVSSKRSAMGRTMCWLVGDRAGGVLMEYVILGVLIASAVVVAVMFFGKNIKLGLNAMGQTVSGNSGKAAQTVSESKMEADKGKTESETHRTAISDR